MNRRPLRQHRLPGFLPKASIHLALSGLGAIAERLTQTLLRSAPPSAFDDPFGWRWAVLLTSSSMTARCQGKSRSRLHNIIGS